MYRKWVLLCPGSDLRMDESTGVDCDGRAQLEAFNHGKQQGPTTCLDFFCSCLYLFWYPRVSLWVRPHQSCNERFSSPCNQFCAQTMFLSLQSFSDPIQLVQNLVNLCGQYLTAMFFEQILANKSRTASVSEPRDSTTTVKPMVAMMVAQLASKQSREKWRQRPGYLFSLLCPIKNPIKSQW